jgi:hypothetical protein
MAATKVRSLLASGEFKGLTGRVRRLMELQQTFLDSAPPLLAQASRVGNCRGGTLLLLADNAAVAAKLRQLAPRLLARMREREPEITGIQIEVQVRRTPDALPARPGKSVLNPEAIEKISRLSEAVPASPLKSALAALVRHHADVRPATQATSTRRSRT